MVKGLAIHWTPDREGNLRGVLALKTNTRLKSQTILLGTGRPLQPVKKVDGRAEEHAAGAERSGNNTLDSRPRQIHVIHALSAPRWIGGDNPGLCRRLPG